jgi:hypothetical protein
MTGEEMVAWKRWHDLGRRKYQFRFAIRALLSAIVIALFNLSARRPTADWVWAAHLTIVAAAGVSVYFFAGHHWDARNEEYCHQSARGGQA